MGTAASVVSPPEVVGLVVFLVLSAFFSGSETALFCLRRSRVEELARGEAGRRGRAVAQLLSRPHDLLVAILFGNLVVNLLFFGISAMVAFRLHARGENGLAAAVGVGGLVAVVVFGEVVPKSLAVSVSEPLALWAGPALAGLMWALRPVLLTFLRLSDAVSRLFVRGPAPPHITAEELKMLVMLSRQEQGFIGPGEEGLLIRTVELGDMSVREVTLPRVDVPFFELGRPREELLALIKRTHRELILVERGGADVVVGMVRSARVLLEPARPAEELVEPVALVPESWTVEELLREFRRRDLEVAVVVDEYGGTSGLVRLSDLVEALMGSPATGSWRDLEKETLREGPAAESAPASSFAKGSPPLAAGGWLLDARTSIRALGRGAGMGVPATVDLTEVAGLGGARPVTVGGLVTALLGRWPVVGDQVECPAADGERKLRFTVTEMRGRRLTKVRVDMLARGEEGGNRPPLSSI